jgi:hypothetical protein
MLYCAFQTHTVHPVGVEHRADTLSSTPVHGQRCVT